MITWQKILMVFVMVTNDYATSQKLQISDAEYSKMPAIFTLDSYRSCLLEPQDIYCNLEIKLDSNETSPLLDLIKEYSAHVTRFNHQILTKGVCVSRFCAKYINVSTKQPLTISRLMPILQQCLNESFWHEYSLDAYVTRVLYCDHYKEQSSSMTNAQWAVVGILGLIIAINIFGSLYASSLDNISDGNDVLLAFSIENNVDRLLNGSKNRDNNFQSLLGIRFISTLFVIIVHTGLFAAYYIENPKFIEDVFDSSWKSIIIHATTFIEFFFVCSSFLLSFNYFAFQATRQFSWWFLIKGFIDRFLRLTPLWLLIMVVIVTWQPMFGSGPFWRETVDAESTNCKQNWWKILLFVGNYVHFSNDICMPHTWYLATDMQLFIPGLIFVMLVYQYPQQAWLLFTTLIAISIAVPAFITYQNEILPVFLYGPETRRESFAGSKEFVNLYVTSYGHICSSAIGLLAGWLQYRIHINKVDLGQWKIFYWMFILSIPGCYLLLQSDIYFYRDSNGYEPVSAMLYAGAIRLAYSLCMAVIIMGPVNNCDKYICRLLEWAPLQCLGRMSYCAYMVHVPVLKQYFGTQTTPVTVTEFSVLVNALGCATVTYLLAFVLCVLVEYPVNELRRLLFKSEVKQVKKE